ncbi:amino acid transporter [Pedobacter sp. BAL39]|uniref:APC family permease n=1 Tax=Pedobacter sp. BAL39 TaxID=391596 RepID=UPI0001559316|nr:APC family permease [Pedobacter sp. BAL39]EDM36037.1 amino acid transporter [Pedobacter sp. BAL39]
MSEKKQLSLFDLSMIVISLVIGMGIYRTPVNVAAAAKIPELFFLAWLIGGGIALCGALTYAEIGSRFPVTGGYYKIFSAFYHPSIAFAINCIIVVSNAGSVAGVAIIGAEYLSKVILPEALQTESYRIAIATVTIILFYLVNLLGLKVSSKAQNVLSVIKIAMVLTLISSIFFTTDKTTEHSSKTTEQHIDGQSVVTPVAAADGSAKDIQAKGTKAAEIETKESQYNEIKSADTNSNDTKSNDIKAIEIKSTERSVNPSEKEKPINWTDYGKALGVCLIAVSFTFGGYQQTINFGGETKDAGKVIPRAIITGLVVIITLYLTINYAYVKVIGFDELKTSSSIAAILAGTIFGPTGFTILSFLIYISVLGYVNVNLLSNPRAMFAMGEERALPAVFTKKSKKNDVMFVSLSVFAMIAIFTLFYAQTFEKILNYTIFLDCIGMATSAATIFFLRKRSKQYDPSNQGSIYAMRLYPLLPLIFIGAYCFVAFSIYNDDPEAGRNGLLIFFGFIIIYFINRILNKDKFPEVDTRK